MQGSGQIGMNMSQNPATQRQVPDHAIMDAFNKPTYLGNQYLYSLAVTAGTSETPVLYISNPAVASSAFQSAAYKSIFQNIKKLTCLTATQSVIFKFYFNPTISGAGTPVTPINLRPASPNTSVAAIASGISVSANGTYIAALSSGAFAPDISTVLSILDPGQSLLVTATASAASTACEVEMGWYDL